MMYMEEWALSLSDKVWEWLQTIQVDGHPGWIRFCREGDLFQPGGRSGLGLSCLGLKTAYMLNLISRLPPGGLDSWTAHIQSFQTNEGYFEDPALLQVADRRAKGSWRWWRRDWATRRAETRQASSALLCVNAKPTRPFRFVPRTPDQVRSYLRGLPWGNPWAAGSHAGHLMAFLHVNADMFGDLFTREQLLPVVLAELDSLQNAETGCWGRGQPSVAQLINGAMKVITGYAFVGLPFRHAEQLIDFALSISNDRDACHHADLVYVLHQCSQLTDHRFDEVRSLFENRLSEIAPFRKPDGAFSFRAGGAGLAYYGVSMSQGLPVSDIHGTTLFVWTTVMIADLLGWRSELGWHLPLT